MARMREHTDNIQGFFNGGEREDTKNGDELLHSLPLIVSSIDSKPSE